MVLITEGQKLKMQNYSSYNHLLRMAHFLITSQTDFSTAHYYNEFTQTFDTLNLKSPIVQNGVHLNQVRTIEVYNKWKRLKTLDDALTKENRLTVVSVNVLTSYKYTVKHILKLVDEEFTKSPIDEIQKIATVDTTNYDVDGRKEVYKKLKILVEDYQKNQNDYQAFINDRAVFEPIIKNLNISFIL